MIENKEQYKEGLLDFFDSIRESMLQAIKDGHCPTITVVPRYAKFSDGTVIPDGQTITIEW